MDENKIYQNTDPKNGPLDGIQLRTDCVRMRFTSTGYSFKLMKTKANVSASVETGTFSIRDMQTDTMLVIKIEDAMAVCAAAAEANRRMSEYTETKENAEVADKESNSSE